MCYLGVDEATANSTHGIPTGNCNTLHVTGLATVKKLQAASESYIINYSMPFAAISENSQFLQLH